MVPRSQGVVDGLCDTLGSVGNSPTALGCRDSGGLPLGPICN